MTDYIKNQLKMCAFADLSNYDEKTNTFFIPKYTKPTYDLRCCYLVRVSKEQINNTNSIMAVNWNNGRAPQNEYYKIYVSRVMAKYIYCDCVVYDFINKVDTQTMWSGWFDTTDLTQLAKL